MQFDPFATTITPPPVAPTSAPTMMMPNNLSPHHQQYTSTTTTTMDLLSSPHGQYHAGQQQEGTNNNQNSRYNHHTHPSAVSHRQHHSAGSASSSVASSASSARRNTPSSSSSSHHQHQYSILQDKTIAPPPKLPQALLNIRSRVHPAELSLLPPFDLVQHSGECLARFSLKSIIIKKWRPTFWIAFGDSQILFFRSKSDFEEWISNPYLKEKDRKQLIKFHWDVNHDLIEGLVQGYSVSSLSAKEYSRDGHMHHFKLEKWDHYGPSIYIALGGKSEHEVKNLRSIIKAMIDASPQDLHHIPSGGVGDGMGGAGGADGDSYHSDYSATSGGSAYSGRSFESPGGGGRRFGRERGSGTSSNAAYYEGAGYVDESGVPMNDYPPQSNPMDSGTLPERRGRSRSGLRGILRSKSREPGAGTERMERQGGGGGDRMYENGYYAGSEGVPSSSTLSPSSSSSLFATTKSILKNAFQKKESDIEATSASPTMRMNEGHYYHQGGGSMASNQQRRHERQQQEYYMHRPADVDYGM